MGNKNDIDRNTECPEGVISNSCCSSNISIMTPPRHKASAINKKLISHQTSFEIFISI